MVAFPTLPSENEDPWWTKRTAWDSFVEDLLDSSMIPRGTLPNGTDLDSLTDPKHSGVWTLTSSNNYPNAPFPISSAATLLVNVGSPILTVSQVLILGGDLRTKMAFRERFQQEVSLFSPWEEVMTKSNARTPYQQIVDLAKRDGWVSVFDPGNPSTRGLNSGYVQQIRDGLGNKSPMTGFVGQSGALVENAFGQMDGVARSSGIGYSVNMAQNIDQRAVIMQLVKWSPGKNDTEYMNHYTAGGTYGSVVRGNSSKAFGLLTGQGTEKLRDTDPHIVTTIIGDGNTELLIDRQSAATGKLGNYEPSLGYTAMGSSQLGTFNFNGTIGPMLIHTGNPTNEQIDRMHALLSSLSGIDKGPHLLDYSTVAYSVNSEGRTTFVHGDVDSIFPTGIASMTKMMTWLTATTIFTPSELNSLTATYQEGDDSGAGDFQVGDTMTLVDWAWMALGPSRDAPNNVIAREGGLRLLDGAPGDPQARYLQEMNDLWESFGYVTRPFSAFFFAATLSAREVADLLQRALANPWMNDLMKTPERTVTVVGANARTMTRTHTIVTGNPYEFPQWLGGKTGSGNSVGHIATAWTNPKDGLTEYTIVLNTPLSDTYARYKELRKLMMAVSFSGANYPLKQSTSPNIGTGVRVTGSIDITSKFSGASKTSSDQSGIFVERRGDMSRLIFRDVTISPTTSGTNAIPFSIRPRYAAADEVNSIEAGNVKSFPVRISNTGSVSIYGVDTPTVVSGSMEWDVRNGWPESL